VPVQFLGFPEFMSNRATAENTMEPVALVSISEQRSWLGGFDELFNKAILLKNQASPRGSERLAPKKVTPIMRFVTRAQIERLRDLYLPLWQSGAISQETLLRLLPDVDTEDRDPDQGYEEGDTDKISGNNGTKVSADENGNVALGGKQGDMHR